MGALSGIKVLDLSRVLAAPLAAQTLADLGADVVKIERPGKGDEGRSYGPPFLKDREGRSTGTAAFFLACNRGKKSVTVDHATAEGQDIIRRLALQSDVLLENFRVGVLKKYGLDADTLRALNPRLVYCSVTGFGQDGPYAQRPGYDGVFQAMGGVMAASGHADEPMKIGISMVDILTGQNAAIAILAALRHRDQVSGQGQFIDMALLDCGVAALSHFAMNYLVSGEVPQRRGNGGFGGVPSQAFDCADGMIFIVAGNDKQFGALCRALGCAHWADDPRFDHPGGRVVHRDALLALLRARLREQPVAHWLALLDASDVPASPVNELPQVFANPQVRHRGLLVQAEHPQSGALPLLASPLRLSATPVSDCAAPPTLGQHTREVLRERLAFTESDLDALAARGVI
jgi:crotonobetainyl-CoA:carnitine CoA-transferase CaiB-like acyl-CoA transferase